MKTRLLLIAGLIMLCSGCSVVQPATATEADRASAYIYQVEQANKGRASRVIWVNPPRNKDLVKKG
jgi:PBP1b-binding outer membrane lipoprotein LpoB